MFVYSKASFCYDIQIYQEKFATQKFGAYFVSYFRTLNAIQKYHNKMLIILHVVIHNRFQIDCECGIDGIA